MKTRVHGCLGCFTRCTDKACDANHRCLNCGDDYIYFVDSRAKKSAQKFLKKYPNHLLANLVVNFDAFEKNAAKKKI